MVHYFFIIVAFFLINLPFFIRTGLLQRVIYRCSRQSEKLLVKKLRYLLFDLLVVYFLLALFAVIIESLQGPLYPQRWEFFAVSGVLFLVFCFPGFVFRFLWQETAQN